MSAKYNASIRGHNSKLSRQVDAAFEALQSGDSLPLCETKFSHRLLFHEDVVALLEQDCQPAVSLLSEITELRTTLLRCVLQMVSEIALKFHGRYRSSSVLEYLDYFQEGALAAYEATMAYHPNKQAKWSSFCYTWVSNTLSRWTAESSRLVNVPRYLVERLSVVVKARDAASTESITDLANEMRSAAAMPFTEDEVELLLTLASQTRSRIPDHAEEAFPQTGRSPLEETLENELSDTATKVLSDLPEAERLVLALRYGLDGEGPRSYDETAKAFNAATGGRLTADKAEELDLQARSKLSKDDSLRSLWEE